MEGFRELHNNTVPKKYDFQNNTSLNITPLTHVSDGLYIECPPRDCTKRPRALCWWTVGNFQGSRSIDQSARGVPWYRIYIYLFQTSCPTWSTTRFTTLTACSYQTWQLSEFSALQTTPLCTYKGHMTTWKEPSRFYSALGQSCTGGNPQLSRAPTHRGPSPGEKIRDWSGSRRANQLGTWDFPLGWTYLKKTRTRRFSTKSARSSTDG
jgi:hypothetical protein